MVESSADGGHSFTTLQRVYQPLTPADATQILFTQAAAAGGSGGTTSLVPGGQLTFFTDVGAGIRMDSSQPDLDVATQQTVANLPVTTTQDFTSTGPFVIPDATFPPTVATSLDQVDPPLPPAEVGMLTAGALELNVLTAASSSTHRRSVAPKLDWSAASTKSSIHGAFSTSGSAERTPSPARKCKLPVWEPTRQAA